MFGTIIYPHRTRSVSKPYLVRTKSKVLDTEQTRIWYGSGNRKQEKQTNYYKNHIIYE